MSQRASPATRPAIEREGFILHPLALASRQLRSAASACRRCARFAASVSAGAARPRPSRRFDAGRCRLAGRARTADRLPQCHGGARLSPSPRARRRPCCSRARSSRCCAGCFGRKRDFVLVQNPDDRAAIQSLGVSDDKIALIPGSGVDIDALTPLPDPPPPVAAGFVGRLLTDKGVPDAGRGPCVACEPRPAGRAPDRRRARSGQPRLDPADNPRRMEAASRADLARPSRRHRRILGAGAYRRAAVAARRACR